LAAQYGMEEDAVRAHCQNDMLIHDIKMKRAVDLITSTAIEED